MTIKFAHECRRCDCCDEPWCDDHDMHFADCPCAGPMDAITTDQAADQLGVTTRRVRALITAGRLPALRIGRDWLIDERDLDAVRDRKPGRPKVTA